MDKVTPKKIVDLIAKESKIDRDKIKNVEVYENFSFMNVPFAEAEYILDIFKKQKKGRKPLVEKAKVKSDEKQEEVTPSRRGRKPKDTTTETKENKTRKRATKEEKNTETVVEKPKRGRKKKSEGSTSK